MAKIGYARVSTKEQNLDLQIEYLENNGVDKGLIFLDKGVSGTIAPEQRDGFKQLLQKARSGDTLVVYKLDRISRKYDDVQDVIKTLKDIGLNFEIGGLPNINTGNKLMDKALTDMLLNLLGYVAENERAYIKERQRDGIELAKKQGRFKGKPKKYSAHSKDKYGRYIYNQIVEDLNSGMSCNAVRLKHEVGVGTVQRIAREIEEDNNESNNSKT
ncbi:recombinase family protein [Staphylococcus haemolyticus]|uniref:recombinase family protein n=1 Tax=Staphylococcus haemolyticus TaxID=1283 RepID=UPI001F0AC9E7|nr:recombinase family protein [Staphylococcus haemolyticus]MCH4437574.1 recombinase family protein [Staphylococcus haemolyticus]